MSNCWRGSSLNYPSSVFIPDVRDEEIQEEALNPSAFCQILFQKWTNPVFLRPLIPPLILSSQSSEDIQQENSFCTGRLHISSYLRCSQDAGRDACLEEELAHGGLPTWCAF